LPDDMYSRLLAHAIFLGSNGKEARVCMGLYNQVRIHR